MYTDDEKRVGLPLKTFILSLILIIIFILLLMWLLPIPKNSNNNNSNSKCDITGNCPEFPNITGLTNRIFIENIRDMKDAAISYFTTDKLPGKEGESVKLTLQDMLDKHLILPLTDKDGKTCDTKGSYVTLTKLKDSYELKVNLKCGEEEAYILVPLGCYSYCTSAICENKEKKTTIVPIPVKQTPTPTPTPTPVVSSPSCELYVSNGTKGNNDWYVSDVTIGFKGKTSTNGATITAFGLGTSTTKEFNNKNDFVVNQDGTITVYGYVKDSNGYTSTCSINVKRDTVKPTCDLDVLSGTKGANGNYVSNVEVGFISGIERSNGIYNYGLANNSTVVYNRITKYSIKNDGSHTVYGFVTDEAGNESKCELKVIKETPPVKIESKPSCTLKVISGQKGDNGWYTGDVKIGFETKASTNGATITAFGLGTTSTVSYNNNAEIVVNKDGTTSIYGYVKDSNGYTSTCSLPIKRDTVKPTCELGVISGTKGTNGNYVSDVIVGFISRLDKNNGVTNYGIANNSTVVYNRIAKQSITKDGSYTIYGFVTDEAGNESTCKLTLKKEVPPVKVVSNPSCSLKVISGQRGDNGWYTGDVKIGFETKTSTNGATITAFGLGNSSTPNYNGNESYVVNTDGSKLSVLGYVKDSNGYTSTCSISIKRDATKPTCEVKVTRGTYNTKGYFISDVQIGFGARNDSTSGIATFGLGTKETYGNLTKYTVTTNGITTVYGYVKDNAGNTNLCSVKVDKKDNIEYQYKKNIATKYSDWSAWTTTTYNPKNPPQFGNYALIEMVDLGKSTVVDYYKESTGNPIYKYKTVKVGTATQTYCKGYDYYRETTTNKTTAIKQGTEWKFDKLVTTTGWPADTLSVKYEFVGFDWKCTGCERTPKKIWNKYTRTTYIASSSNTVTSTSNVKVTCAETETKTIEVFDTVKIFVDYERIKTPVYKDVYNYKKRTRSVVQKAYVDYKWSYYDDKSLLNDGYSYTGNKKTVG